MGIVVPTIKSEGKALADTVELLELLVHHEFNRIPEASLTFVDGNAAKQAFELSDQASLLPGKKVSITLRREGERGDVVVFEGLIVRHAVEAQAEGSVLRVDAKDAAFRLTRQRKSAVFGEQNDADTIRKLIKDAGLKVGKVAATKPKHAEMVQYNTSDWDFIVSRADVDGLVVRARQGEVSLVPMVPKEASRASFEYGRDLYEFELELDAGAQWSAMDSVAWDATARKTSSPTKAKEPSVKAGNTKPKALAADLGGDACTLFHPGSLPTAELQAWADARLARSRLAYLRGRLVVDGTDLQPGDVVKLGGIGDRFNGEALVSMVEHRVGLSGWQTELRIGLSPDWFARAPDITEVAAAGLLPAVSGLTVATVDVFESDPTGALRVRVRLCATGKKPLSVWARFAVPDAGKDRGQVAWPEAGDEVVVGFIDGDPRHAVVLGALYSKAVPPPEVAGVPNKDNFKRAIVSKAGAHILFDDGEKTTTIADTHGNKVVMDKEGITITSAKNLKLTAAGDIVIEGESFDVKKK